MKLTDIKCRNTKPKTKPYKVSDGGGLYLLVKPDGARYWRMKYYYLGKEDLLAVGVYPHVSLAEARESRDKAKKLLAAGKDPKMVKKDEKRQVILKHKNSFEAVAREWHEKQLGTWSPKHGVNVLRMLEADIFPYIGKRPVADIDPPELLDTLRKIEKRGAVYMAGRVKQICGQIFRYGVATGKCKRDASADLRGALKTRKTKHYAALDIRDIPEFLQKLEKNDARLFPSTRRAIKLLMLTFVRPSELIKATWDEFDLENGIWEIPAERMKMGKPHIVPLSKQAIALLKEQKEEIKHLNTQWVFPGQVSHIKHMSNNTVLFAMGRMGYKGKQTAHGFRAVARTAIREKLKYEIDAIELQLAHAVGGGNKTIAAYDRTKLLDERKKMMQGWANHIDTLASQGVVVVGSFTGPRKTNVLKPQRGA